jgi:hypothetical protein
MPIARRACADLGSLALIGHQTYCAEIIQLGYRAVVVDLWIMVTRCPATCSRAIHR